MPVCRAGVREVVHKQTEKSHAVRAVVHVRGSTVLRGEFMTKFVKPISAAVYAAAVVALLAFILSGAAAANPAPTGSPNRPIRVIAARPAGSPAAGIPRLDRRPSPPGGKGLYPVPRPVSERTALSLAAPQNDVNSCFSESLPPPVE